MGTLERQEMDFKAISGTELFLWGKKLLSSSVSWGSEESTNRKIKMINRHWEKSDSAIITFIGSFEIDYLKCIIRGTPSCGGLPVMDEMSWHGHSLSGGKGDGDSL